MAFGFIEDVPVDEKLYGEIRARMGDETPDGLIAHIAVKRDGGLRYIDVWESEADWKRFHEATVDPAVVEVLAGYGITPDPARVTFETMDLVETWVPSKAATPA